MIYGVIFPFILLYFALSSHFQLQKDISINSYRNKMNDQLNILFDHHADPVFFHSILQKNFRIADKSKMPNKAIHTMITQFKNRFKNNIKFIIWDQKGKIITKLSEIKGYKYVLKLVYKAVKELSAYSKIHFDLDVDKIPILKKIYLLRKVLGRFLIKHQMSLPLRNSYLGRCLTTSTSQEKGLLWYQMGKNFSLVCFINKKLLKQNMASRLLVERSNQINEYVKLGALNLITHKYHGISTLSASDKAHIALKAENFNRSSFPFVETKKFLFLFQQPSEKLLIFSYLKKENIILSVSKIRNSILAKLIILLVTFSFVLYCYSLKYNFFDYSIKQKLITLFLFVNLISLLTIVATSYKFFDYKKIILINDIQKKSFHALKSINKRYASMRKNISEQLNQFVHTNNEIFKHKCWSPATIESLKKLSKSLLSTETFIVSKDSPLISIIKDASSKEMKQSIKLFMQVLLDFANKVPQKKTEKDYSQAFSTIKYDTIVDKKLSQFGRVCLSGYLLNTRWRFVKLLGDSKNYMNWGIAVFAWHPDALQKHFFVEKIKKINKDFAPRKIVVMSEGNERIFPHDMQSHLQVKKLLHRTFSRSKILNNNLRIGNKEYVTMSLSGTNTLRCSMLALYPRELVENQIFNLKIRVIFIIILGSILLLFIAWLFLKSLISPVSELAAGIKSIQNSQFNKRIETISNDELGDLEVMLNETMESMKILSVGTAVQKSLLPNKSFNNSKIELFADSVFMTKMGGDYFDYFDKNGEVISILFGDVAGHGIPAGMVMGMAKAIVMSLEYEQVGPVDFLRKANNVLRHVKKTGWRGAMTFQCIDINYNTGDFAVANAGHCFPLIISPEGTEIRYVKAIGLPLGTRVSKKAKTTNGTLQTGETMFLYSDGILESLNKFGEQMGYDRFEQLFIDCWSHDIQTYWNSIYKMYKEWSTEQDDDITFMLIRKL